jgi:hypothetical protein
MKSFDEDFDVLNTGSSFFYSYYIKSCLTTGKAVLAPVYLRVHLLLFM